MFQKAQNKELENFGWLDLTVLSRKPVSRCKKSEESIFGIQLFLSLAIGCLTCYTSTLESCDSLSKSGKET